MAAKKRGRDVSGRTIDLNVTALANVLRWCVVEKWLAEFPAGWQWEAMAAESEECELLTDAQVDQLCLSAMSVPEMGLLKRDSSPKASLRQYLEGLKAARQNFSDYLRLLSLTGAREQETLRQRWPNVRWNQRKFHFPGGRRGGTKRGGGSRRAAKPRDIDFFDKLEAHSKEMYERRNPKCDWMFPNEDGSNHVKSYRKQLDRVRSACQMPYVGFHHFRHYFISWCVMKGVDVKTIAHWVGHLDEGLLILQKYGHLAPGHGQEAAKKLDGPWQAPRGLLANSPAFTRCQKRTRIRIRATGHFGIRFGIRLPSQPPKNPINTMLLVGGEGRNRPKFPAVAFPICLISLAIQHNSA